MGHPAWDFCWRQEEEIEEGFFVAALFSMTTRDGRELCCRGMQRLT